MPTMHMHVHKHVFNQRSFLFFLIGRELEGSWMDKNIIVLRKYNRTVNLVLSREKILRGDIRIFNL